MYQQGKLSNIELSGSDRMLYFTYLTVTIFREEQMCYQNTGFGFLKND